MQDYKQKISQLKWLKSIGVDHFLQNDPNFKQTILQTMEDIAPVSNSNSSQQIISTEETSPVTTNMARKQPSKQNNSSSKEKNANITHSSPDSDAMQQARKLADAATTIDELKSMVENFAGCGLKNLATNTVFADGVRDAKVALIGEAPGANEDKQGIPFCGESGKLLDKMIETIGLSRESNTYITNTVFWRPPANRRPTTEEIDICRPFVEKHIALLNPDLIILVGSVAATSLLGKHAGISNIRKNSYSYSNRYISNPVAMKALFHPAYLLRQPSQKKSTWFDLIRIQQFLKEKPVNP